MGHYKDQCPKLKKVSDGKPENGKPGKSSFKLKVRHIREGKAKSRDAEVQFGVDGDAQE